MTIVVGDLNQQKDKLKRDIAFLEGCTEAQVIEIEEALKMGGEELVKAEMQELYHIAAMTVKRKKALATVEESCILSNLRSEY